MINYIFKYRGPLEYDKFVLNIFQYCNQVNHILYDEINTNANETLKEYQSLIDNAFNKVIQESEKLDTLLINYKEDN